MNEIGRSAYWSPINNQGVAAQKTLKQESAAQINTKDTLSKSEEPMEKHWTIKQRFMAAANGAMLPYVDTGGVQILFGAMGASIGASQCGGIGAATGLLISQLILPLPKAIQGFINPESMFKNLPHTSSNLFFEPWQ